MPEQQKHENFEDSLEVYPFLGELLTNQSAATHPLFGIDEQLRDMFHMDECQELSNSSQTLMPNGNSGGGGQKTPMRYNNLSRFSSWSASNSPDIKHCVNPNDVIGISSNKGNSPVRSLNAKDSVFSFSPLQIKVGLNNMLTFGQAVSPMVIKREQQEDTELFEEKENQAIFALPLDVAEQEHVKHHSLHNLKKPYRMSNFPNSNNSIRLDGLGTLTFSGNPAYKRLKSAERSLAGGGSAFGDGSSKALKRHMDPLERMPKVVGRVGFQKLDASRGARRCLTPVRTIGSPASQSSNGQTPNSSPRSSFCGSGSSSSGGSGSAYRRSTPYLSNFTRPFINRQHATTPTSRVAIKLEPLDTEMMNTTDVPVVKSEPLTAPPPAPVHRRPASSYPKPAFSYSCLITLSLKNSRCGLLPVSDIYSFLCDHFPFFVNAPIGWKNSVRHNLSLNKCFSKVENDENASTAGQRKGCLWKMTPERVAKMDDEVAKHLRRDRSGITAAMVQPEQLEAMVDGELKHGSLDYDGRDMNIDEDAETEAETAAPVSPYADRLLARDSTILDDADFKDLSDFDLNDFIVETDDNGTALHTNNGFVKMEREESPETENSLMALKDFNLDSSFEEEPNIKPGAHQMGDKLDFSDLFYSDGGNIDDIENRMPFENNASNMNNNVIEISPNENDSGSHYVENAVLKAKRARYSDSCLRETHAPNQIMRKVIAMQFLDSAKTTVVVESVQGATNLKKPSTEQARVSRLSRLKYVNDKSHRFNPAERLN